MSKLKKVTTFNARSLTHKLGATVATLTALKLYLNGQEDLVGEVLHGQLMYGFDLLMLASGAAIIIVRNFTDQPIEQR